MKKNILTKITKKLSDIVYGEDRWIERHGNFRMKQAYGLVKRPHYCYGMLRAADQAKYFGYKEVTILEFGVASGAGLLNMVKLAKLIKKETGINFNIIGFDAGEGLPPVQGYRDHAELWMDGDFSMEEKENLLKRLGNDAKIIFGDINNTIDNFIGELSVDSPIGFISIDVDIYTGTVGALRSLLSKPDYYLPAISMYFDDISFFFANKWAGELLAIQEFNDSNEFRKIDLDHSLPGKRPKPAAGWYKAMYVCHILDHDIRNKGFKRDKLTISEHNDFMRSHFLY